MAKIRWNRVIAAAALCLFVGVAAEGSDQKAKVKSMRATGEFDVKLAPLAMDEKTADALMGRMSIDKQFRGDIQATSKGEMLSTRTATPNSAGYVAIEKVTGKLGDRTGTFVLQHSSLMTRGEPTQSIIVVPDSGTGELVGLAGKMTIKIVDKKHQYEFEYTLPEKL